MNFYNIIESVGKIAFGIASLGLVGYLIKLLTEINRNQKEHNQLIKDQFQEREKTRDQEIAFLKVQHQKETEFMRLQKESLTENMESEKRILEQRISLLQEQMRLEAPDEDKQLAIGNTNIAQEVSKQLDSQEAETKPSQAIEAMQRMSLLWAHNLKNSLISLSLEVESLMTKDVVGRQEMNRLLQYVRQLNTISHAIGSTSDRAVSRIESVSIQEIFHRALSQFRNSKLVVKEEASIATLPAVITDPFLLEQTLAEIIRNAEVHGANACIFLGARVDVDTIHLQISNDLTPNVSPDSLIDLFRIGSRPDKVGYGLWMVRQMICSLGGDITVSVGGEATRRFTVELILPTHTERKRDSG